MMPLKRQGEGVGFDLWRQMSDLGGTVGCWSWWRYDRFHGLDFIIDMAVL